MKIDLSQFREVFLLESTEHLTSMEADLLALRSNPGDIELMNAIFRAAHSIKGGAGSFGLTSLVRFTHVLENLLDRLRSLELPATEDVIAVLLQSVDVLRGMLQSTTPAEMPADAAELLLKLSSFDATHSAKQHETAMADAPAESVSAGEQRFRVHFRPSRDLFASGCNPLLLLRELHAMGTVQSCTLHTDQIPPIEKLDPEACYLSWTVELASAHPVSELREVFEFVEHLAEISVEAVLSLPEPESFATEPAALTAATTVLSPSAAPVTISKKIASGSENNSIRVSTEKVDHLIDLVGELVIAHAMTEQMVNTLTPAGLPQLRQAIAGMERNMRELHERVMSIRMMPVGSLFQRYTRTVYDIAKSTGKNINLVLKGEETEIDKSMLELLGDPLTHLIRNAADHGIESPERRAAQGKPEEGRITLTASHRAGRIAIEISDDGAGVDPERVRVKAVERGLIGADAQMTDQQLRMLIFEAGFSTRDEVSDLSGRGVGMDVVKRNIQDLNGSVTLASQVGLGSTITIELPLTLAILEGLLVRVRSSTLVLPLLAVVETVSPTAGQTVRVAERAESLVLRGEPIPLLQLSRFLGLDRHAGTERAGEPHHLIVVVEADSRKIGLVVDELLGQQQVVLKSLERHMHKVDGLMGATILGDGCVAPIVDIAGLAALPLFSLEPAGCPMPHFPAMLTPPPLAVASGMQGAQ